MLMPNIQAEKIKTNILFLQLNSYGGNSFGNSPKKNITDSLVMLNFLSNINSQIRLLINQYL